MSERARLLELLHQFPDVRPFSDDIAGAIMEQFTVANRNETLAITHTLTLDLRKPPLTMNEARSKTHWSYERDAKNTVAWMVRAALRETPVPALGRSDVLVTWFAPDARRRDADASGLLLKAALDELKGSVWPDDDSRYVRTVSMRAEIDRLNPRIDISITELEAA